MTVGIIFETLEGFEQRNAIITANIIASGIDCENYATPLKDVRGYWMEIVEGYENNFSVEEIADAVNYIPLQENL